MFWKKNTLDTNNEAFKNKQQHERQDTGHELNNRYQTSSLDSTTFSSISSLTGTEGELSSFSVLSPASFSNIVSASTE